MSVATKKEMLEFLETFTDPNALGKLEAKGIIKKKGKGPWYYIIKPNEIPQEISRCAAAAQQITKKNETVLLWKFPSSADVKKAQALLKKLKGK